MEWTCTHLRYLLAIYTLSQKAPNVGAAAVARALGVSCPSVTRMLGILTQRGLLERERYGKIHLTDQGLVLARTFSRKVALVTERLPRMELALTEEELKMFWQILDKLEHAMERTTVQRKEGISND